MFSEVGIFQLIFIIPVLAMIASALITNNNIRDFALLALSVTLFFMISNICLSFFGGEEFNFILINFLPDIDISFRAEPLGLVFAMLLTFLWPVTILYSIGYMRANKESNLRSFGFFFSLAILSSLGIAMASNLITLFVFYEILTLSTFPLVTHKKDKKSYKAGKTYIRILVGNSIMFLLPAIAITWSHTHNLDFITGSVFTDKSDKVLISVLFMLYIAGITKSALMPFHKWLPSAMVAPTPVSALLHAVAVVKSGVFSIIKISVYIFGLDTLKNLAQENFFFGGWLTYVAGFTIIIASFIALHQDNLKKMLAYSTISQLSYIIIALSMFNEKGMVSATFQIVAHAFGKITLFFSVGSVYTVTKKTKVSQLNGVGRAMPITMIAFLIGTLSMIGIPPASGFISKWYMIYGSAQNEDYFIFTVMIISTLLNTAYFFPIIYKSFFAKTKEGDAIESFGSDGLEAPKSILIALVTTSLISIALFFYPDFLLKLIKTVK